VSRGTRQTINPKQSSGKMPKFDNILRILNEKYGCGADCPPVTILWAAGAAIETIGVESAKSELSAINRHRNRHGLQPAYPVYGSTLF